MLPKLMLKKEQKLKLQCQAKLKNWTAILPNRLLPAAAVKLKETQTMILRRLGNKKEIAGEIQKHFPSHKIYIEPFFGAGGMFFYKPMVRYNFLNDLDNDVFNLFMVVKDNKEALQEAGPILLDIARQAETTIVDNQGNPVEVSNARNAS